jgi:MYXO-CTERM domain-containing protein
VSTGPAAHARSTGSLALLGLAALGLRRRRGQRGHAR